MASVAAVQIAALAELGVDAVLRAERAELAHAASEASAMRIASAWPQRPMSVPILGHQESAKPPLRPERR